ncbi:MAG: DNRLRE domain-containing protein [Elusimicrobia bacterium]|nr:DNRLRE domain-containing protein [Elusimicrobiota bacterium]
MNPNSRHTLSNIPLLIALLALGAAISGGATTSTLNLSPVADTKIANYGTTTNYGGMTELQFGSGGIPLLRFDFSNLPSDVTILSATLRLTCYFHYNGFPDGKTSYNTYDLARNFVEMEATWEQYANGQPWSQPGLDLYMDYNVLPFKSDPVIIASTGAYAFNLKGLLDTLRSSGTSTANITFSSLDWSSPNDKFYSREYSDPTKRPSLELIYSDTTPQARAGNDIFLTQQQWGNNPIPLDGSGSSLPGGGTSGLNYVWTLDQPAPGSGLSSGQTLGTSALISFNPDVAGTYQLKLRVTNSTTAEYTEDTLTVTVGLNPHPRLHLNSDLLSQLTALKNANAPIWTQFYTWIQTNPTTTDPGPPVGEPIVYSNMLAYVLTQQQIYLDRGWGIIRSAIYKNGVDRSGGFNTLMDIYNNDEHAASYVGGRLLAEAALVYDWGYAGLNGTQKQDLMDWMNQEASWNYFYNRSGKFFTANDGVGVLYGLAAVAYATLGENLQALQELGWFREHWNQVLRVLDISGMGGATQEGNGYGTEPTGYGLTLTANLVYYASGENLFLSHPWYRKHLLFDAYSVYPGTAARGNYVIPRYKSPIWGDVGHWNANYWFVRATGLMISRRFPMAQEADSWNWVFRQPEFESLTYGGYSDLLFYSPPPGSLTKPTPRSYFDSSLGTVYVRSDWDSPDATWIGFRAGPKTGGHVHRDQGSFVIFKRRDLAPKAGIFDFTAGHRMGWYHRTVSANNLLIGNPFEIFTNYGAKGCDANGNGVFGDSSKLIAWDNSGLVCPPNDGGQRDFHPYTTLSDADYFYRYRDALETGSVAHFSEDNASVSWVADITNAYNNPRFTTPGNSPKVNKVYRKFVYLKDPDLLLVADTIESTDPSFEKVWLLHALNRLEVGGTVQTIDPGESVHTGTSEARLVVDDTEPSDLNQTGYELHKGYAALLVKTLFPTQFRYRKVGGRDPASTPHGDIYEPDSNNYNANHYHRHIKDFWVKDYSEGVIPNHRSLNWPPERADFPTEIFAGGYGRWRLQVEPSTGSAKNYFLNVLKPTTDSNAGMPPMSKTETGTTFGTIIDSGSKRYTVTFSKDTLDPPSVSIITVDSAPPAKPKNLRVR